MISYWILLGAYVLSLAIAIFSLGSVAKSTYPQKMEAQFSSLSVFLMLVFGWLICSTFQGNWNNIAILFSIIWFSRAVSGHYQLYKGYTSTITNSTWTVIVCLIQIILLLVYGWGI